MRLFIIAILAVLLVGTATAATVIIKSDSFAAGANDAAYYEYHDDDFESAETLFLAAIDAEPEYQLARYNLATLYFKEARFAEASEQLETLVAMDGENLQYRYDLAVNLVERVRQDGENPELLFDALKLYRGVEADEPGFAHAAENIAVLERILAI